MADHSAPDRTEADLARAVIAYLRAEQWRVYQEVSFNGGIIDLVVTRGPLLGVVECKQALGLPVLEQCFRSVGHAHVIWAATWRATRRGHGLIETIMRDHGFGVIVVDRRDLDVSVGIAPGLRRRIGDWTSKLRDQLVPEQESGHAEAGTNRGAVWTPWRHTCLQLRRVVEESPGLTLKEAIARTKHHYNTDACARSALAVWVKRGRVAGVRLVREGKRIHLMPAEVANA